MPTRILIAGEGGQGIQTISKIIAKAAEESSKKVSYIPSFGVEQRGGVSLGFIQISDENITYPRFSKADIIVSFCNRSIEAIKNYFHDNSLVIFDSSAITNKYLEKIKDEAKNYLAIPAQKIAKEKYSIKVLNMILLGALSAHLKEINYSEIENQIVKELEGKIAKNPQIKDTNLNALKEGLDIAQNFNMQESPFRGADDIEIKREFSDDKKTWIRFPEYCKGCSLCIVRCPVHALQFSEDVGFLGNPIPIVDIEKCTGCGKCMEICPDGAIKLEK